jgi:hypothetical protein
MGACITQDEYKLKKMKDNSVQTLKNKNINSTLNKEE